MPAGMASVLNCVVSLRHLSWSAPRSIWGDGFANTPLNTFCYPRSWSDVSDDELVLFLPHLTGRNDDEFGIAARVRSAYIRRIRISAILSAETGAIFSPLPTTNSLPSIDCSSRTSPSLEEQTIADLLGSNLGRPSWATEAAILDAIDHMLCEASSEAKNTPDLREALLASIHTGINAAYVYPAHTYAHEVLATGAWLGTVMTGRRALMPTLVADICIDYLNGTRRDLISEILQFYMTRLGGVSLYLRHARKTMRSGWASVVRPHLI